MNILYIATPSSVHDIKWISFFSKDIHNKIFIINETEDASCLSSDHTAQLKSSNINILPALGLFSAKNAISTWNSVVRLRNYIKAHEINIVHILFATPYALWGNFIDVPYIITTRGSDALIVLPDLAKQKGFKGIHDKILLFLFRKSFKKAATITGTSLKQIDKINELFDVKNNTLVRTGVDVDLISKMKVPEGFSEILLNKPFIFSPRYFAPIYNIELQLDAINALPVEIKNQYLFVFIKGENAARDYSKALEDKIKDMNVNYHIFEQLSQAQIWYCFKKASLTLITPHSDGTPNTALEAMAAKCPLILGSYEYDKDIFADTCIRLTENNPVELKDKIESALNDYPPKFIINAFSRVKNLGNRSVEMNKIQMLYDSIINA
jgi:glycosyltransferase involved in cell wall biosynthesis